MRMMPFFNLLSHALIMRRSCVIHFQLFVQAAVFILHSASHLVSTNDQRNLNDAFDTIPSTVDCEKTTHTSSDGVSIQICKSGTVAIPTWVERALRLQRLVSFRRDICSTQVFGSHNSGISLAYGYGGTDHILSKIAKVETSNQYFSITDQLRLGIRLIELDIHYFNGGIKVAHCGRFTSSALDTILNFVRNFPFGGKYVYSSGIIGCRPSFSGIPANDQQPVANLLTEIANWVRETPDEFVFVYFDGDKELLKNNQVGSLIEQIKNIFGDIGIFRPSDKSNTQTWPSTQELLKAGKRIMLLSRYDYSAQDEGCLFYKENVCDWSEPSLPLTDYPSCYFKKSNFSSTSLYGKIDRVLSSELQYGPVNADGKVGWNEYILDESNLLGVLKCGVNMPSPDNITPARMQSMIWTMAREITWTPGSCLGLMRNSEFWHLIDCQAIPANSAAACQSIQDPRIWILTSSAVSSLDDATKACGQLNVYVNGQSNKMEFSIPATAYENTFVVNAFKSSGFQSVLFNTKVLAMQ
ncbi:unnamed protein product [Albugo candida]|uniref:Phosphatidylinositol-specific phospholipase C X domain-containing protein n=1 Tax=Albugo candida TaxID=65357 RepID=A0A024GNL0_9STRA|nr:unnamed protein product [Albugo candida]|eukprot:CCI47906.1 unnamed protein product [Albugo candida]